MRLRFCPEKKITVENYNLLAAKAPLRRRQESTQKGEAIKSVFEKDFNCYNKPKLIFAAYQICEIWVKHWSQKINLKNLESLL